jgi:hypothetical protein
MIFILKNCINNTWENHQIPISSFHLHIENTMFSHKRQYCSHWIWWHKLPHFQSSIHRFSSAKQSNLFVHWHKLTIQHINGTNKLPLTCSTFPTHVLSLSTMIRGILTTDNIYCWHPCLNVWCVVLKGFRFGSLLQCIPISSLDGVN